MVYEFITCGFLLMSYLFWYPDEPKSIWNLPKFSNIQLCLFAFVLILIIVVLIVKFRYISKTSSIKPPDSYTSNVSLDKWLDEFNTYFSSIPSITDKEKCSTVWMKLDNQCSLVIQHCFKTNKINSYPDMVSYLYTFYRVNKDPIEQFIVQFLNRNQDPKESLSEYLCSRLENFTDY